MGHRWRIACYLTALSRRFPASAARPRHLWGSRPSQAETRILGFMTQADAPHLVPAAGGQAMRGREPRGRSPKWAGFDARLAAEKGIDCE